MKETKIKPLKKEELIQKYEAFSIEYASYLRWLDDEDVEDDFFIVSTYNYDVNEREVWNSKGREVYSVQNLLEHVAKVISITKAIDAQSFIAQHAYSPGIWLPTHIAKDVAKLNGGTDKIFNIKYFLTGVNLSVFDGGFVLDEDFAKFLHLFIDYPFLFNYKDIDCISLDLDLIVKINNHLDVQLHKQ